MCAFDRAVPLWHTCSGWTPKLRTTKFSVKKLETLLYHMVFIYLQTIISFCHNTCVWQTDRQLSLARPCVLRSRTIKMPQQRRTVVNVPSVHQHIRCGTDRPAIVTSGIYRAVGRPFHSESPATAKLRWPVVVWACGGDSDGAKNNMIRILVDSMCLFLSVAFTALMLFVVC